MPISWDRVQPLFEAARSLPAADRPKFLERECGRDEELRREVESLLLHHEQAAGGFMESPVPPVSPAEPPRDAPSPAESQPGSGSSSDKLPPESDDEATLKQFLKSSRFPKDIIEGYEVVRELHRGGQGVVYQAIQKGTKRKVAIKVLLEGVFAGKAAKRRFEREIELIAQLKHPNIVEVFHSGHTGDGRQYCVMDYVRGTPLDLFVREKKLPLDAALRLFSKVCDAISYAHHRGVIHRDLKPSNILVDSQGNPKVLDFGLAKQLADPEASLVSVTGQVVGTLPYMSPEQARGNPDEIDIRADVYSLGVILYEVLTGQYPYPVVGQIADVLRHIAETPPTPPSRIWKKDSGISARLTRRFRADTCPINDEVQTIVLRSLAKERERRYQSAGDLAADIDRYLRNEPIEAKKDSGWYLFKKGLRRRKTQISIASLTLFAGAVGTIAFSYQREAQKAQRDFKTKDEEFKSQLEAIQGEMDLITLALRTPAAPSTKVQLDFAREIKELDGRWASGVYSNDPIEGIQKYVDLGNSAWKESVKDVAEQAVGRSVFRLRNALERYDTLASMQQGRLRKQINIAFDLSGRVGTALDLSFLDLWEKALKTYHRQSSLAGVDSKEVLGSRVSLLVRLGNARLRDGQMDRAEADSTAALLAAEVLVPPDRVFVGQPDLDDWLRLWSAQDLRVQTLHRRGRCQEALALCLNSMESLRQVRADLDNLGEFSADISDRIAVRFEVMGDLKRKLGDVIGACEDYRDCLRIRQSQRANNGEGLGSDYKLAAAQFRIAQYCSKADNEQKSQMLEVATHAREFLRQGMHSPAERARALRLATMSHEALAFLAYQRGMLEQAQDLFETTAKWYEVLRDTASDDAEVANAFAWFYLTVPFTEFQNYKEALSLATLASESTDQEDASNRNTLALAYFRNGQIDMAIETIEKTLNRSGCHEAKGLLIAALAYSKSGDTKKAEQMLQGAEERIGSKPPPPPVDRALLKEAEELIRR